MRWFKHLADARYNPKLKRIQKQLGEAGYARAMKLLEIVAQRGGTGERFQPRITLEDPSTDLRWLAEEWSIHPRTARFTLGIFAKVRFIDPGAWRENIVYVPAMKEYVDEWTRRRRAESSGATPQSLLSNSPQSQSQKKNTEGEAESEPESDDRKADSADRPARKKSFDSDRDLFLTVTGGRFDPDRGLNGYQHRGKFTLTLIELVRGGVPATAREQMEFMGAVVDACEDADFKAPPGWIRVLSDLRRELAEKDDYESASEMPRLRPAGVPLGGWGGNTMKRD